MHNTILCHPLRWLNCFKLNCPSECDGQQRVPVAPAPCITENCKRDRGLINSLLIHSLILMRNVIYECINLWSYKWLSHSNDNRKETISNALAFRQRGEIFRRMFGKLNIIFIHKIVAYPCKWWQYGVVRIIIKSPYIKGCTANYPAI